MTILIRLLARILGASGLLGLPLAALAQPADAAADETAWFAGEWTVTPAPVEGFETIAAEPPGTVRIEHAGGAHIVRHSPARHGRPAASVEFTVKKLRGNFPWWPKAGGPSAVARRVSDDSFDLAPVSQMGRADWLRALRHTRQPVAEGTSDKACDDNRNETETVGDEGASKAGEQ